MKKTLSQKYMRLPLWLWLTLIVFAAGGLIGFVLSQPAHAGWRYGACKVFLEQYLRFPPTISIKIGGETRTTAVIGFSDINPFGAQQVRVFECHYSQDAKNRMVLSRLTMDRKPLPDEVVKKFNGMLPLLMTQELDTALPPPLPSDLADMKD